MLLSNKAKARFAGAVLLAQAIAAGPAVAGPQDTGPAGAAGVGWAAPVDSAVLRRMTAWTGDAAPPPEWTARQPAFVVFVPSATVPTLEAAPISPAGEADLLYPKELPDVPAGLAAISGSAALRRSIGGDHSTRLVVQWHERTILREAGGISHATTNVTIDIGLDGLGLIRR